MKPLTYNCGKWSLKMITENDCWKWLLKLIAEIDRWKWLLKMITENDRWKWVLKMIAESDRWKGSLEMADGYEKKCCSLLLPYGACVVQGWASRACSTNQYSSWKSIHKLLNNSTLSSILWGGVDFKWTVSLKLRWLLWYISIDSSFQWVWQPIIKF